MKILGATPVPYSRTIYVVELNSDELKALTAMRYNRDIPVTHKDGAKGKRDADKLEYGDVIDPSIAQKTIESFEAFRSAKHEIAKATSVLRGSMTKLCNVLPDKEVEA